MESPAEHAAPGERDAARQFSVDVSSRAETGRRGPRAAIEDAPALAQHWRVLGQARDTASPLHERVRLLSIAAATLDQLFMIRVARLQQQAASRAGRAHAARQRLAEIRSEALRLTRALGSTWATELRPALGAAGIDVLEDCQLAPEEAAWARAYFEQMVMPALIPLAFDPGRPFPHISNLSVNLAVVVDDRGRDRFARIKVPNFLPRLVQLDRGAGAARTDRRLAFVWLEGLIAAHVDRLFPGVKVRGVHPFHVTRDAELGIDDLDEDRLLSQGTRRFAPRRFAPVVRLLVTPGMPEHVLELLVENLEIEPGSLQIAEGPLSLSAVVSLSELGAAAPRPAPSRQPA